MAGMKFASEYTKRSPLHELNPITNLIILICIVILVLFFSNILFSILILVIIILMYGIASLNMNLVIKKARFLVYFSLLIFLIQLLFTPGDNVLFTLIPRSSPILPGLLPITHEGLILALNMTLRFLVIVFASLLFVAITDPNHLAYSLMQLGLPYRYGFMLVTALRFLPQFEIEANTVRKAQLSRGMNFKNRGVRKIYSQVRYTMRPLIVSALEKAQTAARSMEGRGFGLYKSRTFVDEIKMTSKDLFITGFIIVFTVSIILTFMVFISQNDVIELFISSG